MFGFVGNSWLGTCGERRCPVIPKPAGRTEGLAEEPASHSDEQLDFPLRARFLNAFTPILVTTGPGPTGTRLPSMFGSRRGRGEANREEL